MSDTSAERGWIRRIAGDYCWRYRRNVLLSFGAALLATLVITATPLIERHVIDDQIVARRGSIVPWAIALIGFGLLSFAFGFVRRYTGGRLALDVQYDLRDDVFGALQRLDGARQDELATGQVVSRASSDITLIQGLLAFLPNMSGNALLFVTSLVVMVFLSPLLTIVALLVGPGLFFVANRSRRTLFPASWEAQQQAAAVAGVVEEDVTGVRVVKGFGQEAREVARLEKKARTLYASRLRTVHLTARYSPALQAIPGLGQLAVLAFGGVLAARREISLGTFLAFATYLSALVAPVRILAGLLTIGQQARASVVRVLEVIDSQPAVTEKPDALDLPRVAGLVELDNVTFGYVRSRPVLSDFSLRIEPGETLAFVGGSGSGKSTVSLLLSRFYDVQHGTLRLDGHDVRDLTLRSLRSRTGVVFEDSFLFSDSVAANIAYGRPDATREQVVAAAQAAEADAFIRALPDGYDTVVGEMGLTLSGGQRQRVALARALITDPQVLVLDDATSAVDTATEVEIHATLHRLMEGRTTLLIAHRRSTLRLADRIAVVDQGRLVDVGTHEELTDRCPLYRLLLSGPGEDAEGIDAPVERVEEPQVDGVTVSLWPYDEADEIGAVTASTGQRQPMRRGGGGSGAGGGPMGAAMLSMPPTPELLEAVEKLPPAHEEPNIEVAAATAPDKRFGLRNLLRPLLRPLALGFGLVILDALAGLVLPLLVRHGVDAGVARGQSGPLWAAAGVGLIVVLADWWVSIGQTIINGRTGERLLYTLRLKTFAQLQRLGLDYYEREMAGRIMTRMTTDVDALSSFLQTGVATAAVSVLQFAGVLIVLLVLDIKLSLAVIVLLPPLFAATVVFRSKSATAYAEARERISAVNASLQENLSGVRVTQAFNRQDVSTGDFRGLSDSYRRSRMRAQTYISTYFPFVQLLSDLAAALVLVIGAEQVHHGELTAGGLLAFLLYVDLFFSPVQQLSQVFDSYQQAQVGLRRLSELLRTPTSVPLAENPQPVRELSGHVRFEDVHFAYATARDEALRGVTLDIVPGETLAIVGETGAGKSTLVKLVTRYYDVTSGVVSVDGRDVRDLDLTAYRQRLGVVPQEAFLFQGTVRDAIAYGRPESTDAEVEAAARMVGAHAIVASLQYGYLQNVGERGKALSAGQRQLLALARAALVDPDLLILDEATASLDLATEAAVTAAMDALSRRRTTMVIAHRLTTAQRADRIAVMDDGRVAEVGSHTELLARHGVYAGLWASFTGEGAAV